ncbi:MAG: hypothetical protein JSV66_17965 [Trueperaceae bacterium]|nr:MAG: hypothetical protein JSV66_17965 [Trueperaceae bacterium]
MEQYNETELQLRRGINELARATGVRAKFAEGRRESDVIFVKIEGKRGRVLSLPALVEDSVPEYDIEILKSEITTKMYCLMLMLTRRLEDQELRKPERRAKLRHFVEATIAQVENRL